MDFRELVLKNRSYRKFVASKKVDPELLRQLVDLARICPSSKNKQALKYLLLTENEALNFVFGHLKWARYLTNWDGPSKEQQPTAYIVVVLDKSINEQALIDVGIASQTILLGATDMGLGGCIIRSVNAVALSEYFNLPPHYEVMEVIALGYPSEKVQLVDVDDSGSIAYYNDEDGVHYVPKRSLDEIIIP